MYHDFKNLKLKSVLFLATDLKKSLDFALRIYFHVTSSYNSLIEISILFLHQSLKSLVLTMRRLLLFSLSQLINQSEKIK